MIVLNAVQGKFAQIFAQSAVTNHIPETLMFNQAVRVNCSFSHFISAGCIILKFGGQVFFAGAVYVEKGFAIYRCERIRLKPNH